MDMPVESWEDREARANLEALGIPMSKPIPTEQAPLVDNVVNRLLGTGGAERYQLWPERLVRDAISAPHDVMTGKISRWSIDPETGELKTSPGMVKAAMDVSALAGTGGLGGVTDATLGATPFLRPALKYKEKIYKAPMNGQHLDALPKELVPEFQRMAMSGEDISHYNFGFLNHKGHFLDREAALKYAIDEGLMSPHDAKYGALTSTMFADSSKPAVALKAMENAQPFFSAVERNIAAVPQAKMTGEQWLGTIANKPGVKPEELDWTGLKDFLSSKGKETITKADIEKHLGENAVKVNDVWRGSIDNLKPDQIATEKWQGEWDKLVAKRRELEPANRQAGKDFDNGDIGREEWSKINKAYRANETEMDFIHNRMIKETAQRANIKGDTKYHNYQLPGGENYRELLMTMPKKDNPALIRRDQINKRLNEIQNEFDKYDRAPETPELKQLRKNLYTENQNLVAEYNKLTGQNVIDQNPNYKSSHWDEPNILAHVRMNDRDIPSQGFIIQNKVSGNKGKSFSTKEEAEKGLVEYPENIRKDLVINETNIPKKSLHLEEIQSDWHQHGRDKGYRPQKEKELADLVEQRGKLQEEASVLSSTDPRYKEIYKELPKIQTRINEIGSSSTGVPDAPFKKSWHELALKRAIREASEKGYDRLSWTPGEAQAARYDLSKQLKELQYLKNDDGTYQIAGVTKEGGGFNHPDNIPANKLPDVVGKEMAEKIIKNEGRRDRGQPINGGYFSGVDLKVGGEGMKGFYDQIIPKAVEKLTGQKVQRHKGMGVHYIDITPELKQKAMKGFPLFSDSPAWIINSNGELEKQ